MMNPMMMASAMGGGGSVCVLLDGAHHVRKCMHDCLPTNNNGPMQAPLSAALLL